MGLENLLSNRWKSETQVKVEPTGTIWYSDSDNMYTKEVPWNPQMDNKCNKQPKFNPKTLS